MAVSNAVSPAFSLLTPRAAVATVFLCFGLAFGLLGGSVAEVARVTGTSAETIGSAFFGVNLACVLGFAPAYFFYALLAAAALAVSLFVVGSARSRRSS